MFEAWWTWRVTWKGPEMTRANDKGGDTSRGSDAGTLNVSAPDFSATLAVAGPSLRVVLRGTADVNVLGELARFLGELHARAGAHGAERVALDLSGLEFINSSCLKRIVSWIARVQAEPFDRRYQILLIPDPTAQWQSRFFRSLAILAPEVVLLANNS